MGPVSVCPVDDAECIRSAIKATIARGNPKLTKEDESQANLEPDVLQVVGVDSWGEFARGTIVWSMERVDGMYRIHGYRKHRPSGWVGDPGQKWILPSHATIDDLCDWMIDILQATQADLKSARGLKPARYWNIKGNL
jgi:hypothetical protein